MSDIKKEPLVATAEEWDEIRRQQKAAYPIWYFFHKVLPIKWRRFRQRLRDIKYWPLYRLHPKHRYHVVRTGLEPGYHEPDTRMFYACFWLLERHVEHNGGKEFMENECNNGDAPSWDNDGHNPSRREMRELYRWWTVIRPARDLDWYKPGMPDAEMKAGFEMEDDWEEEDQAMLIRLVKIRQVMWS